MRSRWLVETFALHPLNGTLKTKFLLPDPHLKMSWTISLGVYILGNLNYIIQSTWKTGAPTQPDVRAHPPIPSKVVLAPHCKLPVVDLGPQHEKLCGFHPHQQIEQIARCRARMRFNGTLNRRTDGLGTWAGNCCPLMGRSWHRAGLCIGSHCRWNIHPGNFNVSIFNATTAIIAFIIIIIIIIATAVRVIGIGIFI